MGACAVMEKTQRTTSPNTSTKPERSSVRLEVRTYEDDPALLSAFVMRVWEATYRGRMVLPNWTPEFFDWQLTWRAPEQRPYCVAAYDGSRLVGTLLGEEFVFRWQGRDERGSLGSWLSVDPDYRRQGVGGMMLKELKRRHLERGASFQIGYGYRGSRLSLGPKFWKQPRETEVPRSLGFWVRVLDYRAVADWEVNRVEGWGARTLGWWQRGAARWAPHPQVRGYQPTDLPRCLELTQASLENVHVGIRWDAERLAHQLDYKGFPRTLIYDQDGAVGGLANYHVLDFFGRDTTIRVGMIDFLALGELPRQAQRDLVRTMLRKMHDEGVALAMLLRSPCYPTGVLLQTGFIPRPADLAILLTKMRPDFDAGSPRRFHLFWR